MTKEEKAVLDASVRSFWDWGRVLGFGRATWLREPTPGAMNGYAATDIAVVVAVRRMLQSKQKKGGKR